MVLFVHSPDILSLFKFGWLSPPCHPRFLLKSVPHFLVRNIHGFTRFFPRHSRSISRPFFCKFRTSEVFTRVSPRYSCSHVYLLKNICIYRFYPRFLPRLFLKCTPFFILGFLRFYPFMPRIFLLKCAPIFLIRDFKGVIRYFGPDCCSNANPFF